jgi:hypothetical protein
VPRERLASQCDLFNDPALLAAPYAVCSSVPLPAFQDFVAALNQETLELTNDNVGGVALLCAEFGFRAFAAKLSAFKASLAFRAVAASEDAEARLRIAALEERWLQRDHEIAELRSRISRLEAEVLRLRSVSENSQLQAEILALKSARTVPAGPAPPAPATVSAPKIAAVPPSRRRFGSIR